MEPGNTEVLTNKILENEIDISIAGGMPIASRIDKVHFLGTSFTFRFNKLIYLKDVL